MKIVARTPTELIIRDSAMTLRVFGVVIAALGAFSTWLGLTQEPDGRVAVVPTVIGSLLLLGGLSLIVLPSRKTFAFSKTERVFVVASQRFWRVRRQTITLRDIADVSLDESTSLDEPTSSEDGSMYRVVLTLADGRRIPWRSYYTAGYRSKRAVVEVVRDFLGLGPTPGPRA